MWTARPAAVLALALLGAQQPAPPQPVLLYWTQTLAEGREGEGEGLLRRMRTHMGAQYPDVVGPHFFSSPFEGARSVHAFTYFDGLEDLRRFERRVRRDEGWSALLEEATTTFEAEGAWSGYLFPLGGATTGPDPLKPYRTLWAARAPLASRFLACRLAGEVADYMEARCADVDARAYSADLHQPGAIYLFVDYCDLGSWQRARSDLLADEGFMELQRRMSELVLDEGAREAMLLDLEFDPEQATPHYVQGRAFEDRGELDLAVACYRRALEVEPDLAVAHHHLGHTLLDAGRPEEAARSFQRRIELEPEVAEAYRDLARALEASGDVEGMRASLRAALRARPDDPYYLNRVAWALAGPQVADAADLAEALRCSARGVELVPDDADMWGTRGVVLYRAGQLPEALAALERAMDLADGGSPYDWLFVAMVRHRLGEVEEAPRWYERAVAWMDRQAEVDEDLARFRAEAEAVLAAEPAGER